MADQEKQMDGYRLATAEIVYHMPEQPHQLQTFVWQTLDLAPEYPQLLNFIGRWQADIQASLHSVRITNGHQGTSVMLNCQQLETGLQQALTAA